MGKGSSKGHTPREAKDNLKSTQLLSVIDAISEGPVEGPVDGLKSVAAERYAGPGQRGEDKLFRCYGGVPRRRAGADTAGGV
ncbi:putative phage tail component [Escherichia coli]|uniref:Putative phage tail component n=1 Tax=Escherichia coli TaxID=562 RepID=A0A376P8J7_ECOLX|nr:putative phage tail component [Escherichia coli]